MTFPVTYSARVEIYFNLNEAFSTQNHHQLLQVGIFIVLR